MTSFRVSYVLKVLQLLVNVPVSAVPIKFNRHAIPATAHGLFVSKTFWRMSATTLSCTTQRTAAVKSELPTPRPNVVDKTPSRRMKENARPTLLQVRSFVDAPGPPSIVENSEEMLMGVRG